MYRQKNHPEDHQERESDQSLDLAEDLFSSPCFRIPFSPYRHSPQFTAIAGAAADCGDREDRRVSTGFSFERIITGKCLPGAPGICFASPSSP